MRDLTLTRKILLSMMIVGALGSTVGAGSYATFNGSTTNEATFTTGTVVLGTQKNEETTCVSAGGGASTTTDTNAKECGELINVEVKKPGQTATVDLTLHNHGNLPGTLTVRAAQVCASDTAPDQSYAGGADACAAVAMTIQQYESALARTNATTTNGTCWYGGGGGTDTCTFDATKSLAQFVTENPVAADSNLALGSVAAGEVRYLRLSFQLPLGASNLLQGTRATFGFTWQLDQ